MKTDSSLKDVALRTWVAFLVVTGGILLLLFLNSIRSVLLQLVIALILAIALNPLMKYLQRLGLSRVLASVVTLLITVVILVGIFSAIASPLLTQGGDLIRNAPHIIDQMTANPVVQRLDQQFHFIGQAKSLTSQVPQLIGGHSSSVLGAVGSLLGVVTTIFVILTMVLFMLMEGPTAWGQFLRLLPSDQSRFVSNTAGKIMAAVGGFVNGNLFISLIAGLITLIILLIAGIPYPFALAALLAVFDLIPLVGATIATVIIALVALLKGVVVALIVVGVLLVYQFVEGNIIQPIVYGKSVRLSQLLIVVASIVGALLGGIIGVLLAIPVAAAIQIVIIEILRANGAQLEPEIAESVKK